MASPTASPYTAKFWFQRKGLGFPFRALEQDPEVQATLAAFADPAIYSGLASLARPRTAIKQPWYSEYENEQQKTVQQILTNQTTPDEAVKASPEPSRPSSRSTTLTTTVVCTAERRAGTAPRRRRGIGDTARAYLLNAPAMIVIGLLVAYPIGYSFWFSLHRYNLKLPALERFVWFQNYISLVSDPAFLSSLRVTVGFVVVVLGLTVILGTDRSRSC